MENEQKQYSGRGGWRNGGRPATDRNCQLLVRISKEAKEKINAVGNKSETIDRLIKENL